MTPDEFSEAVLTLRDHDAPPQRRLAILRTLQFLEFGASGEDFPRAAYLEVLRLLLDDPVISPVAIDTLASVRDPHAQRRLLDVVARIDTTLVPSRARAVQLLSYDMHGPHLPACRALAVDTTADIDTRIESIRALAVDPTAVPLLVRLLTSASEPIIVRLWAGLSLRALTPPAFASIASTMMANVNEDASLRQMCESAFRTSPTLNRRVP